MDASDGGDYGEWREEWGSDKPLETRFVFVREEKLCAQNSYACVFFHRLRATF